MTTTAPAMRSRGMHDLAPAAMARFRWIEAAFREELLAWGYDEIRTPTIEPLHLFTSAGALSPQFLERVYSFLDWDGWSGERVVLRPDATIPAARLFGEQAAEMAKLFYVQNVFRFAPNDEAREQWQCGAELYGPTWPAGDIELIAAGRRVLERLGFSGVRVRLSHTGVVRALLARAGFAPEEQAERYDRILDGDAGVTAEIEARLPDLVAPLHLLFGVTGSGAGYLANVRGAFLAAVPEMVGALDQLETVVRALEAAGAAVEITMTLARDFEYYTGPVFQFTLADGTIAGGGGRYDRLVQTADGQPAPACGFALYADLLAERLPERPAAQRVTVLVTAGGALAESSGLALAIAQELQGAGFCAELVGSRRNPACRWLLTVTPAAGRANYELRDLQGDGRIEAGSMAEVLRALGRGAC